MSKLQKQLFVKTYKLKRAWERSENSPLYTDLDSLSLRIKYQTLYGFIYENGLEQDYLDWAQEQEDKN